MSPAAGLDNRRRLSAYSCLECLGKKPAAELSSKAHWTSSCCACWRAGHNMVLASHKMLSELSRDWLQIEEGSLYPCLHRLEERGWVKSSVSSSENNRRARYYELTRKGSEELRRQIRNWREFSNVVEAVLD